MARREERGHWPYLSGEQTRTPGCADRELCRESLFRGTRSVILPSMSSLPLRAGPLTCVFDPVLGAVRYIRFGQRELVRSVYGAVRDRSWNTVAPRVHSIEQHDDRAGTTLTYRAEAAQGDVAFAWTGRVECGDEGTLRITFDGEALTMFWRNRIGLCVLHPLDECAGQACTVTTSTGVVARPVPDARLAPSGFRRHGRGRVRRRRRRAVASESASRATRSRWRISATGATPPSRPTRRASRCRCRSKSWPGRGSSRR